jgi:hypothetical protein
MSGSRWIQKQLQAGVEMEAFFPLAQLCRCVLDFGFAPLFIS